MWLYFENVRLNCDDIGDNGILLIIYIFRYFPLLLSLALSISPSVLHTLWWMRTIYFSKRFVNSGLLSCCPALAISYYYVSNMKFYLIDSVKYLTILQRELFKWAHVQYILTNVSSPFLLLYLDINFRWQFLTTVNFRCAIIFRLYRKSWTKPVDFREWNACIHTSGSSINWTESNECSEKPFINLSSSLKFMSDHGKMSKTHPWIVFILL